MLLKYKMKYNTKIMDILKYALIGLIATCLSVSADQLKQKTPTSNFSPTKISQRQEANEVKPDFIPIYLYARENSLDGDYNYRYETANGIFAEERGVMLNKGTETEANSVVGSYKYISPEGLPIEVTYTAGVDGFRAYGAHLPVGPPSASNVPKNLAFKNIVPNTYAHQSQFRSANSDVLAYPPTAYQSASATPPAAYQSEPTDSPATYQPAPAVPSAAYQPAPAVPSAAYQPAPVVPSAAYQSAPTVPATAYQTVPVIPPVTYQSASVAPPIGNGASQYQNAFETSPTRPEQAAAANNVPEQLQVLYVSGVREATEKPLGNVQVSTASNEVEQLQNSFVEKPELYRKFQPSSQAPSHEPLVFPTTVPQQQQPQRPVEKFESIKPAVPFPQTSPQAFQVQPRVVPALQRVVPGYPQQQPYQQQQQFYNRPLPPPVFNQQQRPGPVHQFSVEPQHMWYVPHNQHGRHFQMPHVQRNEEPPKY